MRGRSRYIYAVVATVVVAAFSFHVARADRYSSSNYTIDTSVMSNFGGTSGSTNYGLTSSGGEAVIGDGAGGSYKLGVGYVAQLERSLSLTVQPSGLVGAYPLDETTGTLIADQSSYGAYGYMQGTLSSVAGKVGTALSFNGSSQDVSVGNNAQTQLSSKGTVETWVKSSTTTGALAAVTKSSNFWLGLQNGKATAYDYMTSTTTSDTTVIADGAWHHIAMTLDSGVTNGSTLYVDGAAKQTFTWTPAAQSGYVVIGAESANGSSFSQYFNGSIDHVKLFNRMLSADEIQAERSAQNSGLVNGLSLGEITPGVSSTVYSDVIVQTDAGSYSLAISQDHNLTDGTNTIPAVSGSIASPLAWSEGTTKGLGFTLTGTNATAISGIWNSGNSYAAFPATATTFYTRTGVPTGNDYLTMRIRADVASTQVSSDVLYTNTITVTGTINP